MTVLLKILLSPLGLIYFLIVSIRQFLYDLGFLKSHKVSLPVISIGNLTFGGTGKSPVTLFFVDLLQKKGKEVAVLSRGYKRENKEIQIIEKTDSRSVTELKALIGDEPAMFKRISPELSLGIGSDRLKVAQALLKKEKPPEVFVLDDAFQHRKLQRNLDVVLIDVTKGVEELCLPPWGRAREPRKGISRADVVLLTKSNLVNSQTIDGFKKKIEQWGFKGPVIPFSFDVKKIRLISDLEKEKELSFFRDKRIALISGIGNPQAFERLVQEKTSFQLAKHFSFPDHHSYSEKDISRVQDFCQAENIEAILTTEKDAVKLLEFSGIKDKVWMTCLEVFPSADSDRKKIDEMVQSLIQ